jgi:hypothetical protein
MKLSKNIGVAAFALLIVYITVAQGGFFAVPVFVAGIFFSFWIFKSNGKDFLPFDLTAVLLCVLFAVMAVALFFSLSWGEGAFELAKYALLPLAYLYFAAHRDELDGFDKIFYGVMIFAMVFGYAGLVGMPGMALPGGRIHSFFGYANTAALVFGIGAFYAAEKFRTGRKYAHIILAGLFVVALLLTGSRVGFVTFAVFFLLYVFGHVRLRIKLAAVAGLFVLFIVLMLVDSRIAQLSLFAPTLVERYISYYDALRMLTSRPLGIGLGIGLGNWSFLHFQYQSAPYSVWYIHNFYLQLALDGGVLAIGLFAAVLWQAVKPRRISMHMYILLFILAGAVFEVHFNFAFVIIYFAFLLAKLRTDSPPLFTLRRARRVFLLPALLLAPLLLSAVIVNSGDAHLHREAPARAFSSYGVTRRITPWDENILFSRARAAPDTATARHYLHRTIAAIPHHTRARYLLTHSYLHSQDLSQAYYHATRLLQLHRFGTHNQELLRTITQAYDNACLNYLDQRLQTINTGINPLFRHISPDFSYR